MRYFVALISVLIGAGAAAGYWYLVRADMDRSLPGNQGESPFGPAHQRLLQIMAVLFAVTPLAARAIYRRLGLHANGALMWQQLGPFTGANALLAGASLIWCLVARWVSKELMGEQPLRQPPSVVLDLVALVLVVLYLGASTVLWIRRSRLPLPQGLLVCPVCNVATDSLKRYEVVVSCLFLLVIFHFECKYFTACPTCMRDILWTRCATNVVPANVLWPLWVLPRTYILVLATKTQGHSREVLAGQSAGAAGFQ